MNGILFFLLALCTLGKNNMFCSERQPDTQEQSMDIDLKTYQNEAGKKLARIMTEKQSNIGIHFDESTPLPTLYDVIAKIGPLVCLIKILLDRYKPLSCEDLQKIKELSQNYNIMFLTEEDPSLEKGSYTKDPKIIKRNYQGIVAWADFVTICTNQVTETLEYLEPLFAESNINNPRGVFVRITWQDFFNPNYSIAINQAVKDCKHKLLAGAIGGTADVGLKIATQELNLSDSIDAVKKKFDEVRSTEPDIYFFKIDLNLCKPTCKNRDNKIDLADVLDKLEQIKPYCWEKRQCHPINLIEKN